MVKHLDITQHTDILWRVNQFRSEVSASASSCDVHPQSGHAAKVDVVQTADDVAFRISGCARCNEKKMIQMNSLHTKKRENKKVPLSLNLYIIVSKCKHRVKCGGLAEIGTFAPYLGMGAVRTCVVASHRPRNLNCHVRGYTRVPAAACHRHMTCKRKGNHMRKIQRGRII